MASVYRDPGVWSGMLTDDTIICRCEEVTHSEILQAFELGARDVRTVKLLSRAGMGWCQGRICGYALSCMTSRLSGGTTDIAAALRIPIASPLPLGLLAAAELTAAPPGTRPSQTPAVTMAADPDIPLPIRWN
jgi:D-hydroxyproline dehydrogenase subunit alpha